VKTRLRFLLPGVDKPVYYASVGGAEAQLRITAQFEQVEVEVEDARQLSAPAELDREGFTLVRQPTAVADFYDLDAAAYEAELSSLLLAATGAAECLVFDHTLRSDSAEVRGERETREPADVVHNDYSDASAEKRLRELVDEATAERAIAGRYAIVNAWRSVAGPVQSSPLACCDARTLFPEDLMDVERRAVDRVGELQLVLKNAQQRWYYYPGMTGEEVLLFKTFDSALDGPARRSAHSAFDLPQPGPPRESIESRALLIY
jgi:hypothetical protein